MQKSENITKDNERQMALFKFSLIAPLVNNCDAYESKMSFFREVASKEYVLPNGKKRIFSVATIKTWYQLYQKKGFDSLIRDIRSDNGNSRTIDNNTALEIIKLKEQFPHITGKAIYQKLVQTGVINTKDVSISSLYRFLKENDLKYLPTVERKAFEMEYSNDCWQCDTSHGPVIKINNKKMQTYLIQIIDDASRLIVGCQFFLNDNSLNLQFVLKQAIKTYGVPKKIFVDNGKPYKNLQFQTICATIGTILIHAKAYSPESKRQNREKF